MSTETTTAVEPKRESLFSKKNRKLLTDPLDDSNPITVQVLGICSALAITVQVQQAVIMSLAVLFVMIGGNVIVSMMRNIIPDRIRIIVQLSTSKHNGARGALRNKTCMCKITTMMHNSICQVGSNTCLVSGGHWSSQNDNTCTHKVSIL